MAIRSADNIKPVVTGQIPPNFKAAVIMRVKSAEFGPSKGTQKPMITLDCEIIQPLQITSDYDKKEYNLDELKCPIYISLSETSASGKPTDNLDYLVNTLLPKLGYEPKIDDENPLYHEEKNPTGIRFEGLQFEILVESQIRKEQKRLPNGSYEVLRDSSGNEITKGWEWKMLSIKNILRKANVETNVAF